MSGSTEQTEWKKAATDARTHHPDQSEAQQYLTQGALSTLLDGPTNCSQGANEATCDRIQCGTWIDSDGKVHPAWMWLRSADHGVGTTIQILKEPTGEQNTIIVEFSDEGVVTTPHCTFFRYLNPAAWNPPAADDNYTKVATAIPLCTNAWESFMGKVYELACPDEAKKLQLRPEAEKDLREEATNAEESEEATSAEESEADGSEVMPDDDSEQISTAFSKLYPDLQESDDVWTAYNQDSDEHKLDLDNEVVCRRLSMAWCDLNAPRRCGPNADLLRTMLTEKRTVDLESCDLTEAYMVWQVKERYGSRSVELNLKYFSKSPMEQYAEARARAQEVEATVQKDEKTLGLWPAGN